MIESILSELPEDAFGKQDTSDDLAFYAPTRLVTHIDEEAIKALTGFYRHVLPEGGRILDLMSSWVSHLPADRRYSEVVGHGMNAEELAANPRLQSWFVQDFNRDTDLPMKTGAFDAALCCVGAQYLQQPIAAFAEVRRVLVSGAPFVVSFSNRCFPTKAVAIWRALDSEGHAALIKLYFERVGFTAVQVEVLADGRSSDPITAVVGSA